MSQPLVHHYDQLPANTYTVLLDSESRELCNESGVIDPFNPTNPITLELKTSFRFPVQQMFLSTAEIPQTQLLIERAWNRLYLSEGFPLLVDDVEELPTREFAIEETDGTSSIVFRGVLPIFSNPIVAVDVTTAGANSPIFQTAFEHGLEIRDVYGNPSVPTGVREPIRLISTPITDPTITNLTVSNPYLRIIDPTHFQLANLPTAYTFQTFSNVFGYVNAPQFANPLQIATVVTRALQQAGTSNYVVSFNLVTGQFELHLVGFNNNTISVLLIPSATSLPALLGFGTRNLTIPNALLSSEPLCVDKPARCNVINDHACRPCPPLNPFCAEGLIGRGGFRCRSFITLDPGNYSTNATGDGINANINLQLRRFYFEPTTVPDSANAPQFIFSDSSGIAYRFTIPYGFYNPNTLADLLQRMMNAANPTSVQKYTVSFDVAAGQFVFSSTAIFGLEFGDTATLTNQVSSTVPARLGFLPIPYRGERVYRSPLPFTVPIRDCCGTETLPATPRFLSQVWNSIYLNLEQKYQFTVSGARAVSGLATRDTATIGNGLIQIDTSSSGIAVSFQTDDIVSIRLTSDPSGAVTMARVIQALDAFRFIVDAGSSTTLQNIPVLPTTTPVVVSLAGEPTLNLFFSPNSSADGCYRNSLPARILGFSPTDFLDEASNRLTSPFVSDFSTPTYLLMIVDVPVGDTRTQHRYRNDNIANVFAKLVFYPVFPYIRLERLTGMSMYMPATKEITKVKLRLLNPDHTLYQLHGRNWSLSLSFVVREAAISLYCH